MLKLGLRLNNMKKIIYKIKYMLWYDLNDLPITARIQFIIMWSIMCIAIGLMLK